MKYWYCVDITHEILSECCWWVHLVDFSPVTEYLIVTVLFIFVVEQWRLQTLSTSTVVFYFLFICQKGDKTQSKQRYREIWSLFSLQIQINIAVMSRLCLSCSENLILYYLVDQNFKFRDCFTFTEIRRINRDGLVNTLQATQNCFCVSSRDESCTMTHTHTHTHTPDEEVSPIRCFFDFKVRVWCDSDAAELELNPAEPLLHINTSCSRILWIGSVLCAQMPDRSEVTESWISGPSVMKCAVASPSPSMCAALK